MYLWEYLGYRVGIVRGWVMPLTRLWEKFAVILIATARKRCLIINSEEKLFRKGISICVKPARAPNTWILWLYSGLYILAQEPACQVTKLKCWRRSSIAFSSYINIKPKLCFRQNWRWGHIPSVPCISHLSTVLQKRSRRRKPELKTDSNGQFAFWWVQPPLCTL